MEGGGSPIRRVIRPVEEEKRSVFDSLFDSALHRGPNAFIDYDLPDSKSDLLNYLCDWRGYVMHGSPLHDLDLLAPVRKSRDNHEFGNRQQIFGSPDAMWAMWFAILDKSKVKLTNNGCVRLGRGPQRVKYYHFELPKSNEENKPFGQGMIYIACGEDFPDKRPFPLLSISMQRWKNGAAQVRSRRWPASR
jgi:hypothetical protein